jgi:hypothetical protein
VALAPSVQGRELDVFFVPQVRLSLSYVPWADGFRMTWFPCVGASLSHTPPIPPPPTHTHTPTTHPHEQHQETYCFPGTLLSQVLYPLPVTGVGSSSSGASSSGGGGSSGFDPLSTACGGGTTIDGGRGADSRWERAARALEVRGRRVGCRFPVRMPSPLAHQDPRYNITSITHTHTRQSNPTK